MKNAWFRRFGWFYLPVSIPGAIVAVAALGFCVQVFLAIDRNSHSVSDMFYGVFPYFACCFFAVDWLAARTNGKSD